MEDMNGIEFAKKIRQLRGNKIVIIMITAYPIPEITNSEVFTIIDRIIPKPFSLKSLGIILSYYLDTHSK